MSNPQSSVESKTIAVFQWLATVTPCVFMAHMALIAVCDMVAMPLYFMQAQKKNWMRSPSSEFYTTVWSKSVTNGNALP